MVFPGEVTGESDPKIVYYWGWLELATINCDWINIWGIAAICNVEKLGF